MLGGTFPALIWHDFMTSALTIDKARAEHAAAGKSKSGEAGESSTSATPEVSEAPSGGSTSAPGSGGSSKSSGRSSAPSTGGGESGTPSSGAGNAAPEQAPAPSTTPAEAPRRKAPRRRHLRRRRLRPPVASARADSRANAGRPRDVCLGCRLRAHSDAHGRGRDTFTSPAAQKRQGSSAACVMPMRVPIDTAGSRQDPLRGPMRTLPRASEVPFSSSRMPSACVSFPGPEQRSRSRAWRPATRPRRLRISSMPVTGASARISTAAPTPPAHTPR